MIRCFNDVYAGRRVLVTGNTGFKGSWLSLWLQTLGAEVSGIALAPKYENDHFQVARLSEKMQCQFIDVRNFSQIHKAIHEFEPDFIFHLAAQAIVGSSYNEPKETFDTNVMGTLNVLEALRDYSQSCVGVFITSDKCYRNIEQIWSYREGDILGGDDPYSSSKGCAELIINSYTKCFFNNTNTTIASTRAGNVIGGGDRSEFRLVPDCFKALAEGQPIVLRNPESTRPWQHVLDPLSGYLLLGEQLLSGDSEFCSGWNFGPSLDETHTVQEVAEEILKYWGDGEIQTEAVEQFHESSLLQLDCTKARLMLGWEPTLTFEESIKFTTEWYKSNYDQPKNEMYSFGVQQIQRYQDLAIKRNLSWIEAN